MVGVWLGTRVVGVGVVVGRLLLTEKLLISQIPARAMRMINKIIPN